MFSRIVDGKVMTVIVVYVDDIMLARKTQVDEGRTLSDLSSCFKINDLGEAELYLGCHITRFREARTLTFDQHIYADTVAKRFNVTNTSMIPAVTGMEPLYKENGPNPPPQKERNASYTIQEGNEGPDVGGDQKEMFGVLGHLDTGLSFGRRALIYI